MAEVLVGTVERITYYKEGNGYTVAQVTPEGRAYTVTVVGNLLELSAGESLRLHGQWTSHARYGRQFQVAVPLESDVAWFQHEGHGTDPGSGRWRDDVPKSKPDPDTGLARVPGASRAMRSIPQSRALGLRRPGDGGISFGNANPAEPSWTP